MAAIDTNLVFALRLAVSLRRAVALLRGLAARLSTPVDPGDARARRDFVWAMTARNPDAFSSDLVVQAIMHTYPEHFS
ncbi:hypothetical protein PGB28_16600 [Primorskyibacter aestuariivivens]|uniref:hypothetical protein n=1 Tax=Primorskyibacter aestuariivivens TaxID=1888912 RepID=UPI002300D45F|nr:hypothetical protein [Primorskyibacter aestuariivivens]MDA7430086.1 hypothetical protein [Primorskyibacter aestuariivivens]